MLLDDGSLGIKGQDFQGSTEGVDQDGEEEQGTALVETGSGLLCWLVYVFSKAQPRLTKVKEDRGDDERHGKIAEQLSKRQAWVGF